MVKNGTRIHEGRTPRIESSVATTPAPKRCFAGYWKRDSYCRAPTATLPAFCL